jgi:predicted alpha-1,2-mannosidase
MEGYTRIIGGWNVGKAYTVYFYALFNTKAYDYGTWKDKIMHPRNKEEYDQNTASGAYFEYKTTKGQPILVKVGISFLSTGKAKANLFNEIPQWDFDLTRSQAKKQWNDELSKIVVETKNEDTKKIFYSSLYRCMLMPVDRTGENPLWKSDEPYYDDFYCIWDTYRSMNPLLTIISPSRESAIIRSLIDIYEHDGYMPDARSGNFNGRTQGGSNCDMLIADAYVKELTGINYQKALEAMIKNAEVAPGGDERKEGRGGLDDYNTLGFLSYNHERAGSRTVEYAANDFAIATVAKGLGKNNEYQKYIKRANNWQNLWRSDMESHGTKGFIWPKDRKGNWIDTINNVYVWTPNGMKWQKFDVLTAGSWPDFFYESNSWEYSLYVPHDVKSLIEKCGGKEKFISRLDTFFTNQYFDIGNEPGFLTPCLYNYAGRPDKTAFVVKNNIPKHFNSSHTGIPGNDDSGAMGSFYALYAMGFFPNAGQDVYLITSPGFDKVTIHLENGKTFEIIAKNAGENNIYIQSATLNGKPFNQCWFSHNDIISGGKFEFILGNKPSQWGTTILPPSLSDKN